jgi:hydrogenase nickel incorporation protein HypA/HybF
MPDDMHELSIALSLVDMACEEAERLNAHVEALHLRIGALSGVVVEALEFSFALAAAGSAIDGARLVVERTPIVARCPACGVDQIIPSEQHLRCPVCRTSTPDVVSGTELELFALEVQDGAAAHC